MRSLHEDDFATLPPVLQFAGGAVSIGGFPTETSGRTTFQCEHCLSIIHSEPVSTGVRRAPDVDERVQARQMLEFWKGKACEYLRDAVNLRGMADRDAALEAFLTCAKNIALYASKAGVR